MRKHVRLIFGENELFELVKRRAEAMFEQIPEKSSVRTVKELDRAWFNASAVMSVSRVRELLRPVLWKECKVPRPHGLVYYDLMLNEETDADTIASAVEEALVALYCTKWYGDQGLQVTSENSLAELKHIILSEEKNVKRSNVK